MPESYHTECVNFNKLRTPSRVANDIEDLDDEEDNDTERDRHHHGHHDSEDKYYRDDEILEHFLDLHVSMEIEPSHKSHNASDPQCNIL